MEPRWWLGTSVRWSSRNAFTSTTCKCYSLELWALPRGAWWLPCSREKMSPKWSGISYLTSEKRRNHWIKEIRIPQVRQWTYKETISYLLTMSNQEISSYLILQRIQHWCQGLNLNRYTMRKQLVKFFRPGRQLWALLQISTQEVEEALIPQIWLLIRNSATLAVMSMHTLWRREPSRRRIGQWGWRTKLSARILLMAKFLPTSHCKSHEPHLRRCTETPREKLQRFQLLIVMYWESSQKHSSENLVDFMEAHLNENQEDVLLKSTFIIDEICNSIKIKTSSIVYN